MKSLAMNIAATSAVLLLGLTACANTQTTLPTLEQRAAAPLPKDTVQTVNGAPITQTEVDRALKVMLAQYPATQPMAPETKKQAMMAALEQLVSAELLFQEAAKQRMKGLDDKVAGKVAEAKAKYPTPADLEQALKLSGITLGEMTQNIRRDIIITSFIEERFASKVKIADAEALQFYNENQQAYFVKPAHVRASHILIGVEATADAEQKQQARQKAEELLKKVQAGEDFAALAKAESTCASKAQGGDLGNFPRGQMVAAFEEAAFAMKPGEVSGVVETMFGYHIIKLTDKSEATDVNFEEAKAKIVEFLKMEQVRKLVAAYIAELRGKATVKPV